MHEGTIAREIIRTAKEEALKAGMEKISTIKVVIGEMHAVVEDALLFLFDLMKKEEEGMEDTILSVEKKPVVVRCKKCGNEFRPEEPIFICPSCGSMETELISGDEMYIESMEGEK